jgi:hypothetical protein
VQEEDTVNFSIERFRRWFGSTTVRIALLLFVLGIATRIPFRARVLHHWDSVNFALAMEHFDVRLHQPHPPGTFVIYIMLGRLFNVLLHDPNASLVWLSVLLSGLGTTALFLLGEELFGREVGLAAALLTIVSPLIWFHGEVALSYMFEFFWVPLIVYFCYRLCTQSWRALLASALLIGLAGGIRPNTPVFLFPLWVVGIIVHRYPLRRILVALVVMGLGVLVWAVPMIMMSGGLTEYVEVMRWWQNQHTEETASLYGIAVNVIRFGVYIIYSLGLGLVPLAASVRNLRDIVNSLELDWRAQALALWLLPAAGYFTLVHLRQPGHTFTIQPAFLLLTGMAIVSLARKKETFRRMIWIGGMVAVVLTNALFFLFGPTYLFGDTRMLFTTPTWNAIHDYDTHVTSRLNAIRETFSPEETAVIADGRNFRLPAFYLSDFQLPLLSSLVDSSSVTLDDPINTLVFFDDSALLGGGCDFQGVTLESVPLPDGARLCYVTWDKTRVVEVSRNSLEIRDK